MSRKIGLFALLIALAMGLVPVVAAQAAAPLAKPLAGPAFAAGLKAATSGSYAGLAPSGVSVSGIRIKMETAAMDLQGSTADYAMCYIQQDVRTDAARSIVIGFQRCAYIYQNGTAVWFPNNEIRSFWFWCDINNGVWDEHVIATVPYANDELHYVKILNAGAGKWDASLDGTVVGSVSTGGTATKTNKWSVWSIGSNAKCYLGSSTNKSLWQLMDYNVDGTWKGQWPSNTAAGTAGLGHAGWTHKYDNAWGYIH